MSESARPLLSLREHHTFAHTLVLEAKSVGPERQFQDY